MLSGGGNLGSIQAGMLAALLQADVVPGVLVGTSIGAANAAFLASDPSRDRAEALCDFWRRVRSKDVFPLNPLSVGKAVFRHGSLFLPEVWRRILEEAIPYRRIEDAAVPLRIMATDFEDGTPVVFDSGPVIDAVMASTAAPLVFPPHRIDDVYYLDGALSEQAPLTPALEAGAQTIYVLAVGFPRPVPVPQRSPGALLRHSLTILLSPRIRLDALDLPTRYPDVSVVQLPLVDAQVGLRDMSRNTELMRLAYEASAAFLARESHQGSSETLDSRPPSRPS